MKFIYSFDGNKTHQLEFIFKVLQYTEKAAGVVDILFSGEIKEILNGVTKRTEVGTQTFSFPPKAQNGIDHDIDFSRIRYSAQKKWIFSIVNNKEPGQKLEIGLISDTANKNPMFLDVFHDEIAYEMTLKGNNISILDENFEVPVLRQTIINYKFDAPGFPEGFTSSTSSYVANLQYLEVNEYTHTFPQAIDNAPFSIKANIAPMSLSSTKDASIFSYAVKGLGTFKLFRNRMQYLAEGDSLIDSKEVFFASEIQLVDFFENIFKGTSLLDISGDGLGRLTIKYKGETLQTTYDPLVPVSQIDFLGSVKLEAVTETPQDRIRHAIDNLSVTFQK